MIYHIQQAKRNLTKRTDRKQRNRNWNKFGRKLAKKSLSKG